MKNEKRFWKSPAAIALGIVGVLPFLFYCVVCGVEGRWIWPSELDGDQWATLLGGMLAYLGTCFVGILAMWQNIQFKQANDKAQDRQTDIINQSLKIEEKKHRPVIGFEWTAQGDPGVQIVIKNYKVEPILDLKFKDLVYTCNNKSIQVKNLEFIVIDGSQRVSKILEPLGKVTGDTLDGSTPVLKGNVSCRNHLGVYYEDEIKIEFGSGTNIYFKGILEKASDKFSEPFARLR